MRVALSLIEEPFRPSRGLQPAVVEALAASIAAIGLQTPITVRPIVSVRGGCDANVWEVVTGRHRLAAAQKLGWDDIEAVEWTGDETEARLWELAENLHRADLSEAERRQNIAEWVRLSAPQDKLPHDAAVSKRGIVEGRGNEALITKAAKTLGIAKDTVARAVAAESLSEPARAAADAAGFGTVKRAEVAAGKTPEAQIARIEEMRREQEAAAAEREARLRRIREVEEAHKLNRQQDKVIQLTEAQQFAEWLLRRTDTQELLTIISWLECAKPKDIIAALRREVA